jgi:SAM-dependent methyltransferase
LEGFLIMVNRSHNNPPSDENSPGDQSAVIAALYDSDPGREWQRAERHRTEFAVTLRALDEYLPPAPAKILDCGGGPGRYAIELAKRGYQVTLFDLSVENLNLARLRVAEAGVSLDSFIQGSAVDLSDFETDTFDSVLLLGPLYHLLESDDRAQAVSEAARVMKPGAPLFAAFISRYAGHRYAAANSPEYILEQAEISQQLFEKGVFPPREEGSFVAFMAHPSEVDEPFWHSGLEVSSVLGVEGLVSMIEEHVNILSGELWEKWVDLNYRVAPDPSIHGLVEHLLVIAYKPRWRTALAQIVRRLEAEALDYKVAGGACLALHGLRLPVKDVDIEMGVDDVYRFQELFPAQVVVPVSLSETDIYRSHFGIFDFDGLKVEVMGDLHRREGDRWLPTQTRTLELVDLAGLEVRVSWLEEETLAYIRRGRIRRAALCLPHCDRARLLSLLRGEQPQGVL